MRGGLGWSRQSLGDGLQKALSLLVGRLEGMAASAHKASSASQLSYQRRYQHNGAMTSAASLAAQERGRMEQSGHPTLLGPGRTHTRHTVALAKCQAV